MYQQPNYIFNRTMRQYGSDKARSPLTYASCFNGGNPNASRLRRSQCSLGASRHSAQVGKPAHAGGSVEYLAL